MLEKYIDSAVPYEDIAFMIKTLMRLSAAILLSGLIGGEREHINRPAGMRTHILVCLGAALVTVTSEYVCRRYMGVMNVDPTRLGAQVVSGIGFLGAGTIIKEGFSVKGLTTSASLWAVSCVGLDVFTFSGSVADCIYAPQDNMHLYNDIGCYLGKVISQSVFFTRTQTRRAAETIRATVIGAGNFSMDVSGSTIEYCNCTLPIKGIPAAYAELNESEDIPLLRERVSAALSRFDVTPQYAQGD